MVSWRYGYYEPSRPRQVKGGIRAQSQRGNFGQRWWARRWIEVLESFNIGARLSRGRSYARRGQVLSVELQEGAVEATVQGSRPLPYRVTITVKTLSGEEWDRLAEALTARAIFSAKLLAGEMPENIEEAFKDAGLALFPSKRDDLETDCSCPDWSNPCKHVAAVYYLLGEEFDRDPFLIFKLRGMGREELTALIGSQPEDSRLAQREFEPSRSPEPLPEEPETFWGKVDLECASSGEVYVPSTTAILPKRLGNFPFWRGEEDFLSAMEDIYCKASSAGLRVFLGEYRTPKHDREDLGG